MLSLHSQTADRRRKDFDAKRSRIEQQLKYEQERELNEGLRKEREDREWHESERQRLEKEIETRREDRQKLQEELQTHDDAINEAHVKAKSVDEEKKKAEQQLREQHKKIEDAKRRRESKKSALERVAEQKKQIISTAVYVDQLSLPRAYSQNEHVEQDVNMHEQAQGGAEAAEHDHTVNASEDDEGADVNASEFDMPGVEEELDFSIVTREMTRLRQIEQRQDKLKEIEYVPNFALLFWIAGCLSSLLNSNSR